MKVFKYKIVSDSMMPLIPIGGELEIEKIADTKELKRFDILLFKDEERLVCHYFWHQNKVIDKGLITTRSLKDDKEDFPFAREKIIGRVCNFKLTRLMKWKILIREFFR